MIVVVVPFFNEAANLPGLLKSLAFQTRPPDRLLLVDDGSTDNSPAFARDFAARHAYATVLSRPVRPDQRDPLAGAAELLAFQWALATVDGPWDIVGKVDADLRLTPDLLAEVEQKFADDPALGVSGPHLSYPAGGGLVRHRCPAGHVHGATKFYRRACYLDISPVPAVLGWDTIDELQAQMRGWRSETFESPGGDVIHRRPMGSRDGTLRGFRRAGCASYAYGSAGYHVALAALARLFQPPAVLGSLNFVLGWAGATLRRAPRAEADLRAFTRCQQRQRLRSLLRPMARGSSPSPIGR